MAFIFQPRAGGRDGVGCALAFDFVEDAEACEIAFWEGGEGFKDSEAG